MTAITDLPQAFLHQAVSCGRLGSPFMERLCGLLAEHWPDTGPLAEEVLRFQGDLGPAGHSLPLRIAGGLHALVLSGRTPELAAVYPPAAPDAASLLAEVQTAIANHGAFLADWIQSAPQTNEIRRSAMLIAGAAVLARLSPLPARVSELGASGGLNLWWDHFALEVAGNRIGPDGAKVVFRPEWTGPPPPDRLPRVCERRGVDLNPLDLSSEADFMRLAAYLWPDQPERLAMTRAGAAIGAAPVDRGDAIDWLEQRLLQEREGEVHLIQNTVAWQYFPKASQARGVALIEAAGRRATSTRPLTWLQVETDGDTKGARGAALTLRHWPGDIRLTLGRADFHGRWIDWTYGEV